MTQNELAFWRDAVIASLHAPGDALERANLALLAYREHKAAADAYHKEFADKTFKAYSVAAPQKPEPIETPLPPAVVTGG